MWDSSGPMVAYIWILQICDFFLDASKGLPFSPYAKSGSVGHKYFQLQIKSTYYKPHVYLQIEWFFLYFYDTDRSWVFIFCHLAPDTHHKNVAVNHTLISFPKPQQETRDH